MSDNPRPDDDEEWTVNEELDENEELNVNEELEENYDENQEIENDNRFATLSRRKALGVGVAALGLGGIAGATYWGGGNALNTTNNNTTQDTPTPTERGTPNMDENTPTPDTSTPTTTPTPTPEEPTREGNVYELEDGITVDLDSLDPIFGNSDVDIGVQENGNLVAWNHNVEIEGDDGNTFNPLYRFRNDLFPDREFYQLEGDHPVEQLYSDLDAEIDEMSEGMVRVFYDEETDEGSWEDHSEYKSIDYQELKEGLINNSGLGPTQDYFFNRQETLRNGEQSIEKEWRELVRDGLEGYQN